MKKFTTLDEDLLNEAHSAQEAFDREFANANDKLLQIKVALEDYKAEYQNDPRNWGYAGSLEHVCNELEDILNFLTNKE